MTINALQHYTKDLLAGLESIYFPNVSLQSYISPPITGDLGKPSVYVWGTNLREKRTSMPRALPNQQQTGGWKEQRWLIDLQLIVAMKNDADNIESAFPVLVEDVLQVMRNTPMPVQLTDPTTEKVSTLVSFGEDMTVRMVPARLLEDQRSYRLDAWITVTCIEQVQA